MYIPRIIYNDDAANSGGGGEQTTTQTTEVAPPLITLDELKGYGFNSPDELKTFLSNQKAENIDPQEKVKQANLQKANLQKYAAENNLMAVDEFQTRESLNARKDVDLVKESFLKEFKEDSPDSTEEDAIAAFESQYPLDSENAGLKKIAERKIAKEAKEIRSPFESKYALAEGNFKEDETLRSKIPGYNKFIDEVINANIPEKLTIHSTKDGDAEINVDLELTAEQKTDLRQQIDKIVKNPKTFLEYTKNEDKLTERNQKIAKKIDGFIKINYFDKAVEKGFETGKGIGVTKGSTVGATQPFGIVRDINMPGGQQKADGKAEVMQDDIEMRRKVNNR